MLLALKKVNDVFMVGIFYLLLSLETILPVLVITRKLPPLWVHFIIGCTSSDETSTGQSEGDSLASPLDQNSNTGAAFSLVLLKITHVCTKTLQHNLIPPSLPSSTNKLQFFRKRFVVVVLNYVTKYKLY